MFKLYPYESLILLLSYFADLCMSVIILDQLNFVNCNLYVVTIIRDITGMYSLMQSDYESKFLLMKMQHLNHISKT